MAGAVVTVDLVADILCSDTPVSNQMFLARTTDWCKRLGVEEITTLLCHLVIVAFRNCVLPNKICLIMVSLICLKRSTVHLYWDYLMTQNFLHYRSKSYS
jgi:hypothetical protein